MKKALALLVATALLGLAACGDDDKDKESGDAQTLSVSVNAQGNLTGLDPVKAGVLRVDFRNDSKNPYDLQLVRVDGNRTLAQVLKIVASDGPTPIPNWLHGAGGVGTVKPGASASATQVLPAGTYYVIANADVEGEGSRPKPSTGKLEIEGSGGGELPAAAATVTAKDYSFAAQGLKAGKNEVRFVNDGRELHHIVAFQLKPGKTTAELKKFFQTEKGEPPIVDGTEQSTAVIDGGTEQVTDLEFAKPGKWALVCFISDRKGGPPHVAKGMISEVDVS